jgi:choline dehydrogenase-like flavoprotein
MHLKCDILIVGSGVAGGTLAATLSERTDKRIVLLEKGPYYTAPFFNQRELDMMVLLADRGASDGRRFDVGGRRRVRRRRRRGELRSGFRSRRKHVG